jgi:hypothetical protein
LAELAADLRAQHAVLVDGRERDALLDVLVRDAASFANEPAIEELRYQKADGKDAHDLKPKPERFARYLEVLVERGSPRSLAFAASFATDVAVDNNGNTKPTALHFTAGQQELLGMAHRRSSALVGW